MEKSQNELDKKELKVLRLDNGEILFSKVLVNTDSQKSGYLELHWPMRVLMKFNDDEKSTHLALLKWLPFTEATSVPLAARCIMSVSDLGEEYIEFYLNSVGEAIQDTKQQGLNRMSKILMDFDETGSLMN